MGAIRVAMALISSLLLLSICITTVAYTNLLVANGLQDMKADRVTALPGQPDVNFGVYSGYVTVNETNRRELFYFFIEATEKPDQKPILLWLNGGPGCSSVGYGAFSEIGAFRVEENGSLSFNNYAWNQVANTLFVEGPIGTGFSYSETVSDYNEVGDMSTALDLYSFILKFMNMYSSSGEIVLAGQHYAAQIITQLAVLIIDGNQNHLVGQPINLKKILLLSPSLDYVSDMKGMMDFAFYHALISDSLYRNITTHCNYTAQNFSDACNDALGKYYDLYNVIDILSVYTPTCSANKSIEPKDQTSACSATDYDPCRSKYVAAYLNRQDVQNALHASLDGSERNWLGCNFTLMDVWNDDPLSVLPLLKKILDSRLAVSIWSGDTNGGNTALGTLYSLEKLARPITTNFGPWYTDNKQVGGFLIEYDMLKFMTFLGVGQDIPSFKAMESLKVITNFLQDKSIETEIYN